MTRPGCISMAPYGLIIAIVGCTVFASDQVQRPVLPEEIRQQQVQAERSALGEAERLDQSKQLTRQLHQTAHETHELLTALQQNAQSFFTNMETLLDSDNGKRIVRDPTSVPLYEGLHKYPAVSLREIAERLDTASALVNRLEMLQSGLYVGYVPTQQTQDQIDELNFWVKDRTRSVESNISVLNSILRKTAETPISPSDKTLRVILNEIEAALLQILADHRIKGEEKAAPDVEKIVVDAAYFRQIQRARAEEERRNKEVEAQIFRIETQAETALLQVKAEAQRQLAEAETRYKDALSEIKRLQEQANVHRVAKDTDAKLKHDDQLAEIQRKQKVALARSQEVRSLLAPFITAGYWQPGQEMPSYNKEPVSLTKLREMGALSTSADGLKSLVHIGEDPRDQVRPRWGFDRNLLTIPPDEYEQLRKAQQYLIDLGDVMVAEGMLTK